MDINLLTLTPKFLRHPIALVTIYKMRGRLSRSDYILQGTALIFVPNSLNNSAFLVKQVNIHKHSWDEVKWGWSAKPNLYVKIEYGEEELRTNTVKDTLSPTFQDFSEVILPCVLLICLQLQVYCTSLLNLSAHSSESDETPSVSFTVIHNSISRIQTTIGCLEVDLRVLRNKTVDGDGRQ